MATPIITEKELRIFMMDNPELNTLVDGVRWTPEDVQQAMINTVDAYNMTAPFNGQLYSVESFPFRYLLMTGTAGYLLKSAAINQASNQLTYSTNDVQINDNDKAQLFLTIGQAYWDDFKKMTSDIKIAQNCKKAYGTKFSEYITRSF